MFLFLIIQSILTSFPNVQSFVPNSHLLGKPAPNSAPFYRNWPLPRPHFAFHFDEAKYADFFRHDSPSSEDGVGISKNSQNVSNFKNSPKRDKSKKEEDSRKAPVRRSFDFTERAEVSRPVNRGVKSRYTFQEFPKSLTSYSVYTTLITPINPKSEQGVNRGTFKVCSNLRICGGSIRGRKLCVPPVYLRPIMSKVKISLFNYLRFLSLFAVDKSLNVIDLFCGTGSLGLEALSYGADKCTFVDISLKCLQAVNINVARCGFEGKSRSIRSDAIELLSSPHLFNVREKFDLMFVCPPYSEVVYSDLLQSISDCAILNEDSVVAVEYPKELSHLPNRFGKLHCVKSRRFGRTAVGLFVYHSNFDSSRYRSLFGLNSSERNSVPNVLTI